MSETAVADLDARRRAVEGEEGDAAERNGVVESDLAQDTPPEPEADAQEQAEPKPTPPMQIPLPGTWEGIGTEFGGRQPDTSEIRLLGGKMPIEGSFAKGTILDLHVRVKVTGVLGQDTVDAFGQEESTVRRHHARMISVKRLDA
jgi:hypothetical protein